MIVPLENRAKIKYRQSTYESVKAAHMFFGLYMCIMALRDYVERICPPMPVVISLELDSATPPSQIGGWV